MAKRSPIAVKILSMWEMASAGRDVGASDFLEFLALVTERRVPSNLSALIQEIQLNRMLQVLAGGQTGRPAARVIAQEIATYAATSYPRDLEKPAPPSGRNRSLYLVLETNRGRTLSAERIRKRLQSGGSKIPGLDDPQNQKGSPHENAPTDTKARNSRPPLVCRHRGAA
jgi:hypothetical protein